MYRDPLAGPIEPAGCADPVLYTALLSGHLFKIHESVTWMSILKFDIWVSWLIILRKKFFQEVF